MRKRFYPKKAEELQKRKLPIKRQVGRPRGTRRKIPMKRGVDFSAAREVNEKALLKHVSRPTYVELPERNATGRIVYRAYGIEESGAVERRVAIIKYFLSKPNKGATINELCDYFLKKKIIKFKPQIYRTLTELVDLGAVDRIARGCYVVSNYFVVKRKK